MGKVFLEFIIIIFFGFTTIYAQNNSFKGITPLYSTRADVENLFGKPQNSTQKKYDYFVENQEISIVYNDGKCSSGWNLEKDVVLAIYIVNKDFIGKIFDDLKLNEKKFYCSTDDAFFTRWTNPIDGLQYYFSNVKAAYISQSYIPKTSDNILRCNGFPPFAPEGNYYTREEYLLYQSNISEFENFATLAPHFLQMSPSVQGYDSTYQGYALVYFDKRKSLQQWRKYIAKFKQFITKKNNKNFFDDFSIIEGGLDSEARIYLYILPKTSPPPSPNPTYPSPQFMRKK
jgi:hypothetical protein